MQKGIKLKDITYQRVLSRIMTSSSSSSSTTKITFYDQPIDSDFERYEES